MKGWTDQSEWKLDIRVECLYGHWYAYDYESYDGAPDGDLTHGTGATKWAAVRDLIDQLEESEEGL